MCSRNSLLQWHDGDKVWCERVLSINQKADDVVCIRIELDSKKHDQCSWPFHQSMTDLDKTFGEVKVRVLEKDPFLRAPINVENLPRKKKRRFLRNWNAIKEIVEDPKQLIFERPGRRRGLLEGAAKKSKLSKRKIYRLLWRYWKGGQTPQCMLPEFENCGQGTRQFKGGKKRGRYSKLEEKKGRRIGPVIDEDEKKVIRRGIKNHLLNRGKLTIPEAYKNLLYDEYTAGAERKHGVLAPALKSPEEYPSLRQVTNLYYENRDPEEETTKREGAKSFALNGRPTTGRTETRLMGPGAVGQMDATTADIYLVSEHDPSLIVGRPTIYGIKDAWCRFLYSLTATFERPSYWGAAIALENALVNKSQYCADYGVTIGEDEWPVDFLPAKLLVDRGEMSTYKSDHLVTGLGVRIGTLPSGRGDLKGIIEQQFRLMNLQFINWLPGALPRWRDDRKDRREFDARLTISEFRRLMLLANRNYHRALLTHFKPPEDVIAAGIQLTPIELLKWGMVHRRGLPHKFPLQEARFHLLPHAEARITGSGVKLNDVHYTCMRAVKEKWFERARSYGVKPIQVAFDPRRVDYIYFQATKGGQIEELVLTTADQRLRGWTWEEVEEHGEERQVIQLSSQHQKNQDHMEALAAARAVITTANARHEAAKAANPDQSKASQLGKMPEVRAAEKAAQRQSSLGTSTSSRAATPAEPEPGKVIPFPKPPPKPAAPRVQSPLLKRLGSMVNLITSNA